MNKELSPETLSKLAKRIAIEIDPEYEALAPMMLEAYMRGGRERRQLFETAPTLGGIMPDGGASILPYAFLALSWVVTQLMRLSNSGGVRTLSDFLSLWKNCLELVKDLKTQNKEAIAPEGRSEALVGLRRILDEVQKTLERQGLPKEQSELVGYRVMKVLLQEPVEAAKFVIMFKEGKVYGRDQT